MSEAPVASGLQRLDGSARKRLQRRYRAEMRFRAYGVAAIAFAILALAVLLVSIVGEAVSALTRHEMVAEMVIDPATIDPGGARDPERLRSNVSAFSDLFREELRRRFPDAEADRSSHRQLQRLVSTLAGDELAHQVAAHPDQIGKTVTARAPVSDTIDLYLKGLVTPERLVSGAAPAEIERTGQGVTVRAPGGFASSYQDFVERRRTEAAEKQASAATSQAAIDKSTARKTELEQRRAGLATAGKEDVRLAAEALLGVGDKDDLALARTAGAAIAGGDPTALRESLLKRIAADIAAAEKEAGQLLEKGNGYARKAEAALASGAPSAETRRIQSEIALLAADRRRVDAQWLKGLGEAIKPMGPEDLIAIASVVIARPLTPVAELAAAAPGDATALARINAWEVREAAAERDAQKRRLDLLIAEAGSLKAKAPKRAEALQNSALPAAKSRLARLERDLEDRAASGERLARIITPVTAAPVEPAPPSDAPPAPAPSPVSDADFLNSERGAQLGLDLGGSLAAAMALGAADQGQGEASLKALVLAHADLDIAAVQKDIERLTRKRDRDAAAARAVLDSLGAAGAWIAPDEFSPSLLVEIGGGVVKAERISPDAIEGDELIPLKSAGPVAAGDWRMRELRVAEADRLVSDRQAAWANALKASGEIRRVPNWPLLTRSDSTYPELAGLAAALVGSFWMMAVTLVLSLPLGVMAAIYLEEFAPKNRLTDFIEVNINNLAAVPSIVFGLLGAAVFINFFHLPRSAPLVGGLVLSLITLPTIIIATRAALGAVPPSIREGALAVGASLPQTVFHHVLPLAAPGIMTGAIIGLARALGETAPLLLIGMVAFVADPPSSMFDSATALPVLVYKWSSAAERAWQPMTSAAIIVLLLFMFAMNALAVYLRRRLERRW